MIEKASVPAPLSGSANGQPAAYLAPTEPIQLRIVQIWEDLLDVRPIGIRDDFFDLRGDSILAVQLIARLEREFGCDLSLDVLLPVATVEHLAEVVARRAPAATRTPVLPIQVAGSQPPLFCMHPAGGSSLCYLDLARCLGPDQPVYGLQGPDPLGDREPYSSIEGMAEAYLSAILEVEPRGPYCLAGHSLGGYVAYEIARQLTAVGRETAMVAMFDTSAPAIRETHAESWVQEFATVLERYNLDDVAPDREEEHRFWLDLKRFARRQLRRIHDQYGEPAGTDVAGGRVSTLQRFIRATHFLPTGEEIGYLGMRRYLRFLRANLRSVRRYVPAPWPRTITLFQAAEHPAEGAIDRHVHVESWARLVAKVDVHHVPGHHLNMLVPPHVESLARSLRDALDAALSSVHGHS